MFGGMRSRFAGAASGRRIEITRSMIIPFALAIFKTRSVTDRPGDWGDLRDESPTFIESLSKKTEYPFFVNSFSKYWAISKFFSRVAYK